MSDSYDDVERQLLQMERKISGIYRRAEKELGASWKEYLAKVDKKIEGLQKSYSDAKAAGNAEDARNYATQLANAKKERTLGNKDYRDMTRQTAKQISEVNKTAAAYINGELPEVYATGYNGTGAKLAKDVYDGISFNMTDAHTVKRLATKEENLLPYKTINGVKDVRWNTQKINSEVLQGIVQGEPMDKIAGRLKKVLHMDEKSAIRNARTAVTGAENAGRLDMLRDAAKQGVHTRKVWSAIHDSHTRDSHEYLDGQEQEIEEPFQSLYGDIMAPGDPSADPADVYNCRCRLRYRIVNISEQEELEPSGPKSFVEELAEKEYSPNISNYNSFNEYKEAKNMWIGEETKYVEDLNIGDTFRARAEWHKEEDDKIPRIEGTIADLNTKYPALRTGDREYGQILNDLTVCDYDVCAYHLPDGDNDRRLDDSAMAQVFLVNKEKNTEVIMGFRRQFIDETVEESLSKRKKAIETGETLLNIGTSPEVTAIHEWGHVMSEHIDNAMIYADETAVGYWSWYKTLTKEEIRTGLSDYATTNRGEFEAECFAEIHMPNPRPLALKYKEYLDEIIKKGY